MLFQYYLYTIMVFINILNNIYMLYVIYLFIFISVLVIFRAVNRLKYLIAINRTFLFVLNVP